MDNVPTQTLQSKKIIFSIGFLVARAYDLYDMDDTVPLPSKQITISKHACVPWLIFQHFMYM